MTVHALRLHPGQDLKKELEAFTRRKNIRAGFIITCVGSLRQAIIRMADQPEAFIGAETFEIVSLAGTLSPDGAHLHIALSNLFGQTLGGHLLEGNLIYTTAELIIGEAPDLEFRRIQDEETGFRELNIGERSKEE